MPMGPTHCPIQWVPGALTPVVKRSEHEADHSPPSSAEAKIHGTYLYSPIRHVVHKDNFILACPWKASEVRGLELLLQKYVGGGGWVGQRSQM
jgi:hypothetical protein